MAAAKTGIGSRRAANAKEGSDVYLERRKEIFQKAALVFEERGYQSTTFADIAERVGSDRATLYYYVGSKQELFQEVVREAAETIVLALEAVVASKKPAADKLRLTFAMQMQSYSSSYPYIHVLLQEKFPTLEKDQDAWSDELKDWADRYQRGMREIIKQGVKEGQFELGLPVGLVTMAVVGTINWAHRWYRPGGKLPPDKIGQGFADLLLKGLQPKKRRAPARPR